MRVNLLMFGAESWSRDGNVIGSINDGDPATWRVTFDGTRHESDWYAVTLPQPERITRFSFTHGGHYHDGGWFDASAGKPQIEVRRSAAGAWEAIATIESYPDTTATDRRELQPGQVFEARCAPVEAIAVRVIGRPACGDNPRQAFSSCAELQAFAD